MTMLQSVWGSLQSMTSVQLLCGFLTCMCYAALQGSLLDGRLRWAAVSICVLAAFGFVLTGDDWVYGFMLLAFAVAGLGLFAALVWVLGSVLGVDGRNPLPALDSAFVESIPETVAAAPGVVGSHPLATSPWTAPSL